MEERDRERSSFQQSNLVMKNESFLLFILDLVLHLKKKLSNFYKH